MAPRHPLRAWIKRQRDFRISRDSRRILGVSAGYVFRVLRGDDYPHPERALAWERITGIPAARLVHPRWKELLRHGPRAQGRHAPP